MKTSILVLIIFLLAGFAFAEEPSGQIVYSQLTGDFWQIWMMDLKTKESHSLTDSPVDKRAPQCNPDGTQLLYRTANAELFLMNLQDMRQPVQQILKDFGTIMDEQWSLDGKYILFTRMRSDLMDDSDIWSADINGKNVKEITSMPALQYYPQFLDEESMIFVSQDSKAKGHQGHNLWRKSTQKEDAGIQLTQGVSYDLLPNVSPDKQTVIFSSNRSGSFDIWQLNLATQELRRLTDQAGLETSPNFSPDGHAILFVSTAGGSKQLWLMNSDGGNQIQITDNQTARQEASWCPSNISQESENE